MLGIIDAVMESSLLSDHSDPIPVCYSQQTPKSVHERPASRSQESTGLQLHLTNSKSESESCSDVSHSSRPHGLYGPWDSPGQNIGMGSFSLLQGIFPTQGLKPRSPALQSDSLPAEPQGKPTVAVPIYISPNLLFPAFIVCRFFDDGLLFYVFECGRVQKFQMYKRLKILQ